MSDLVFTIEEFVDVTLCLLASRDLKMYNTMYNKVCLEYKPL